MPLGLTGELERQRLTDLLRAPPLLQPRLHRAIQSGAKTRSGKTGKGNPYLTAALGEAAASAARTNTFLGARYRRLVTRIGKLTALVAIARSILVIVWELLTDPTSRYADPGPEFFNQRLHPERRKHNHIRQLEALGYKVTLEPAAA